MQTKCYNRQLAVTLNEIGKISQVETNSYHDIIVEEGELLTSIIDPSCYKIFFDYFSRLSMKESSLGFQIKLVNKSKVFAYLLEKNKEISFITIEIEQDGESLYNKILEINNLQANSIRNLSKDLESNSDTTVLFEEIMKLNSSLINARRDLSLKNIQLGKLNNTLEEINYRDYLTQLYNRRKFFKDIYNFVLQKEKLLVMMDFNNFKLVNDEFGHKHGDEALTFFAQIMKKEIEQFNGTLYRLGGDEFAMLLDAQKDIDIDGLFSKIDAKLQTIHKELSMAYGYVLVGKENCNKNNPAEESMRIADEQMFVKKKEQKMRK